MEISFDVKDDYVVCSLSGAMDGLNYESVQNQLDMFLDKGQKKVIINLETGQEKTAAIANKNVPHVPDRADRPMTWEEAKNVA